METTAIDFMPVIQQILMALGAILSGLLIAVAHKLKVKFGLEADEKSIRRVREAIENGVTYGRERLQVVLKNKTSMNIKNKIAQSAVEYAIGQVPSVIKKLKYDRDQLQRWAFSVLAGSEQSAQYYEPVELEPEKVSE